MRIRQFIEKEHEIEKMVGKAIKGNPTITEGTAYSVLFIIGCSHMLNDMIQSVVPSIYPIIKDKFGFTFAQIGIITFVFQLASSLLQPLIGMTSDRHPRPYSLSIGMCFTLCGLFLLAFASNFWLIIMSVCIIGLGSAVFHPEASRVAQMASGGKKSLAQSIFQVGGNGGSAIGPLLAALIVLPYGQAAISCFAVAAVVACLLLIRIGNWYSAKLVYSMQHPRPKPQAPEGLSQRRVYMSLMILVIMIFSKYFYTACITNYFTFFLIDKFGLSVGSSQLCLFAYLAAFAAGTLFGGALGDRFGRKYIIWFSILGSAPFALILPHCNLAWTIVMAVVVGLVISSAFSSIVVYATDLMPDRMGMISGVFFGLMFGLGGIGSAFFGWLADLTSVGYIFELSAFLPLLGIIAGFLPDVRSRK